MTVRHRWIEASVSEADLRALAGEITAAGGRVVDRGARSVDGELEKVWFTVEFDDAAAAVRFWGRYDPDQEIEDGYHAPGFVIVVEVPDRDTHAEWLRANA